MTRITLYKLLFVVYSVAQCQGVHIVQVPSSKNTPQGEKLVEEEQPVTSSSPSQPTTSSPPQLEEPKNITTTAAPDQCNLPPELVDEIKSYQDTVDQIIEYVVRGDYKGRTYEVLAELVDTFGPRMTGSGQLEAAIDWMLELSEAEGLENTHTEDVTAPHWVRNTESAWMTQPRLHQLNMLGLGGSVGTPPEGIKAEVLVVKDFDDLQKHADQAVGKIVVFNPVWVSYGETVKYRSQGASKAAEVGAVASLIRSIGPFSINSPHTGQQEYTDPQHKIPTACITVEDAAMMDRMQARGQKIEVHLTMGAESYPDIITRNTITEVLGHQAPDEAVVVSGHLDSWDVGQGAMDDGGGAMISWNSAVVLQRLGLRPRRTLRAILWAGEEQGLYGGFAYHKNHVNESDKFQLLLESDIGTFNPLGLAFNGTQEATCILEEVTKLLHSLNATKVVSPMDGGPDIEVWMKDGVPTGSLYNANEKYFWFHHSNGDTLSVEDSDVLDHCLAVWTSVAYVAADMTQRIPHGPSSKDPSLEVPKTQNYDTPKTPHSPRHQLG
ncbi:carboxypeptidase Q-like [Homarus americanus]|uniref:carboxypeptidase Q-like n=1 Tax=Homarus americanus TaxID=6706 RepID=UPI001C441D9E|nr:carboxypeptidase Q-like [Homarus americanus]